LKRAFERHDQQEDQLMHTDQIALQLYTVREHTAKDMLGTLRQLGEIGYRAVEFAGYGGVSVQEIRSTLDESGMRAIAAHVPFTSWQEQPQQVVDDLHALGCRYAVLPSLPKNHQESIAQVREAAENFNRWGALCQDAGLQFAYHNHAFEFAPLEDTTIWEILTSRTDPALVKLELDVFWAQYAGIDPARLIEQHRERVPLLHLKDMADNRSDAPVGDGVLQWAPILGAGADADVQWYIVEQDHPRNPLVDVQRSLHNLQQMAS
jgi:sugar phosphate isomerase/epimerase